MTNTDWVIFLRIYKKEKFEPEKLFCLIPWLFDRQEVDMVEFKVPRITMRYE